MLAETVQEWTAVGRAGTRAAESTGPAGVVVQAGGAEVRRSCGRAAGYRACRCCGPGPLGAGRRLDHRVRDGRRAVCSHPGWLAVGRERAMADDARLDGPAAGATPACFGNRTNRLSESGQLLSPWPRRCRARVPARRDPPDSCAAGCLAHAAMADAIGAVLRGWEPKLLSIKAASRSWRATRTSTPYASGDSVSRCPSSPCLGNRPYRGQDVSAFDDVAGIPVTPPTPDRGTHNESGQPHC